MFGNDRIPDTATVSAYDGMHLIYQVVAKLGPKFNPDDADEGHERDEIRFASAVRS